MAWTQPEALETRVVAVQEVQPQVLAGTFHAFRRDKRLEVGAGAIDAASESTSDIRFHRAVGIVVQMVHDTILADYLGLQSSVPWSTDVQLVHLLWYSPGPTAQHSQETCLKVFCH